MSLNWAEIDLVIEELELPGSFIQEIVQSDFQNLFLGIYQPAKRFFLRVCLQTGQTRLHAAASKPKKPQTRQRFSQLLHARIRGGKIEAARQLNRDRVVRLDVRRGNELLVLWLRLWGGAANVLLTDSDGEIIDAFFRRPGRGELSGERFWVEESSLSAEQRSRTDRFHPRWESDLSTRISRHYGAEEEQKRREHLLARIKRELSSERTRLSRRIADLEARSESRESPERLRQYGDLLLANLTVVPERAERVDLADFYGDGIVSIPLRTELSPQQNAERFYEIARKGERTTTALAEEIGTLELRTAETEEQLESLESLSTSNLEALAEKRSAGESARGASPDSDDRPGLTFSSQGFTILVGRNSRENDALLRRHVRGNDVWLHTRDYPGGYVFVKAVKGKSVPLPVLLDAGMLAVHFSKAKSNGRADLYYTPVKFLRRARNGPQGLVLPTQEKNLHVVVENDRLDALLGRDRLTR